jgi:D-amino-acid dehydrogenase
MASKSQTASEQLAPQPLPEDVPRIAAVIGAGFVGLTVAHALIDRGWAVTLIDPGSEPRRPSEGNAGWIGHTDIMPLASPKAWHHLPDWLRDPLGPLAIRPAYLPRLMPWLTRFMLASRPARIEASILALRSLQAGALAAWQRRLAALGLQHHLRERGVLYVWLDKDDMAAAKGMLERQTMFGIPLEVLDGPAVRRLEPALGEAVVGGVLYPDGCHVSDPRVLLEALHAAAVQRGVEHIRSRATRITPTRREILVATATGENIAAGHVVIAAGAWSKPLAAQLGDAIPLDTERGYNATFDPGTFGLSRPVSFEGMGFVTTPLDTGDRIGGAVEFAGLEAAPNYARVEAMLGKLRPLLPAARINAADARQWMGFRPSIPDSLPVIGPSREAPRAIYAFGHGHYGLTQAAITAELVADMIGGRPRAFDPAPFRASRFRIAG